MTHSPCISVVIVCMNRLDNLYPCLEGLEKHCSGILETLVVAYRFSEENLEKVRRDFPEVSFIPSNETRGFSENNNLALKRVRGSYCFILNDDTLISEDVSGKLLEDFSVLPVDAAIVSPRILNADGSLQLCGRPDYPPYKYLLQQWHLYREPIDNCSGRTPDFNVSGRGLYSTCNITGAAFLIRTEVFRELGWFDERYFFTPEDIALSTLARERGFGVYVDSACNLVHKWKATASRIAPAVRPAAVKGSLIFFGRRSGAARFLLSLGVWCAESTKRVKARLRLLLHPCPENEFKYKVFKNISRSIFSKMSPKELFIKYMEEL